MKETPTGSPAAALEPQAAAGDLWAIRPTAKPNSIKSKWKPETLTPLILVRIQVPQPIFDQSRSRYLLSSPPRLFCRSVAGLCGLALHRVCDGDGVSRALGRRRGGNLCRPIPGFTFLQQDAAGPL